MNKETIFGKGIPALAMLKVLRQYAAAKKLPFNFRNWESIVQVHIHYNKYIAPLN